MSIILGVKDDPDSRSCSRGNLICSVSVEMEIDDLTWLGLNRGEQTLQAPARTEETLTADQSHAIP